MPTFKNLNELFGHLRNNPDTVLAALNGTYTLNCDICGCPQPMDVSQGYAVCSVCGRRRKVEITDIK